MGPPSYMRSVVDRNAVIRGILVFKLLITAAMPSEMVCPWCVHGVSIVCLWCVHSVSIVCPWCVHSVSMVCPWCVHVSIVSIVCQSCAHGVSMMCPWCVNGMSMLCPWCVHGVSMVCLWYAHGVSMVCPVLTNAMQSYPHTTTATRPIPPVRLATLQCSREAGLLLRRHQLDMTVLISNSVSAPALLAERGNDDAGSNLF